MCFSAEASFGVGAVLFPAGGYCAACAVARAPRLLPLALVPIAFGIQQCCEGMVWIGLQHGEPALVQKWSVLFLFFAVVFWPLWIALSLLIAETRRRQRMLLMFLTALSGVWIWLYYPVASDPQQWLSTDVAHHSIRYSVGELPGFQLLPRVVWRFGYVLAICVPLILGRVGSGGRGNLTAAALVGALFVASYVLFWYAFLSVWCFFAAVVSGLLCIAFHRLPARASNLCPAAVSG
jgi:hypothetical protein